MSVPVWPFISNRQEEVMGNSEIMIHVRFSPGGTA